MKHPSLLISGLVLFALLIPISHAQRDDIYPFKGQSDEQVLKDKEECYQLAVSESGFDPLLPPDADQPQDKQAATNDQTQAEKNYNRAYLSCLKSRGYAVK